MEGVIKKHLLKLTCFFVKLLNANLCQHSVTKCFMKNRIKDAWMAINLPQYLMQGY